MEYEWIKSHPYSVPAQTVGEKFEELERRDGSVTKENFLDASRPENASTHSLFTWDDGIASEKWRLHESGVIISNVRVKIVHEEPDEEPKVINIRAYVNKNDDNKSNKAEYVSVKRAFAPQGEFRSVVIENAKREFKTVAEKYRIYTEFADVIAAIDRL